ncbi:(Fe-S)-binding protein [Streptomyces thermodiastaticus]|uniref:(Fe-S)-binding protein n=1 Tax=Streptomyces thermodiastaticus TaxID=44061 RepID=UPI0016753254|nr:(Fe-S)-binding protein [Streptomyces thermodiastaticus]MCE7552131.1 (Fe-S)-binding protein [Streptomyces thermodiastaticus]GHF82411.1 Fe-S oxidoreductase [Streptomyces thermodiastaticus]
MRTALFVTCLNDTLFPRTGQAAVELLRRLGVEVEFPAAQSCCGQMHYNTGYRAETAKLARHFVEVFGDYDRIIVPSASCGGMPAEAYAIAAESVGDDGLLRDVRRIAPRVHELTSFLTDTLGVEEVGAYFPHRVTYHPTCHSLRASALGDRPYRLLRAVRGIDFVELPAQEECCGFGGTFSVKNGAVSGAMNGDKARHVRETGAHVLAAVDNSCLMNIGGRLAKDGHPVRTMHLVEILARTEKDGPLDGVPVTEGERVR